MNQQVNDCKLQAIIPPGDATDYIPQSLIDAYAEVQRSLWENEDGGLLCQI